MNATSCSISLLLAFQVAGGWLAAAQPDPKNYILFPIKTDLQRYLLFSTSADAYAQIDVAECVREKKFVSQRIDNDVFRKSLAELVQQAGIAKPTLVLNFRYADVSLDPDQTKLMESAVTTICRQAGFAKVVTSMNGEGESWHDKVAQFTALGDDLNATESPVEDELVRVYPVRTKLSRFLLRHAEEDCFIKLREPIDGRFRELSPATRQAIAQLVAKLGLPRKRRLMFSCDTTTAGQESLQRYLGRRDGNPPLVDAFVKELGFQSSNFSWSPASVSPEGLLGKQAPDFTLDGLDGGPIHLADMIRGRVAVITFWGVACGPCRAEAPHLTALYNQYKDRGLAIVAVNAYDESKEEVERFARANGLTHPIALLGKTVGEEKYTVNSYPVTFLVDHRGVIVDYHLDFEQGDEKVLARVIARLLAEREKANDPSAGEMPTFSK
jgi:thiol-disulfide isomerase/thioredoxin